MAAPWTTDDLLLRVKRKAQRPLTDLNFTDADILNVAEEELYTFLAPIIRSTRGSYYLKSYRTGTVAGQSGYRLPPDCSAGTLRDVWFVDQNGLGAQIPLIEPEARHKYITPSNYTIPAVACVIADEIVFYPTPTNATYTLQVWYEQRRSRLTTVAACGRIIASPSETTFTLESPPNPDFVNTQAVDVIEGQPNFDLLSTANPIVGSVYSTLILTNSVSSSTRVGAYMCPTGFSCIVPLPDLFHFALVFATAAALGEEVNDAASGALRGQLMQRLEGIRESVEPRVVGQAPMAVNWNSPLRTRLSGGWFGR